MGTMQRLFSDDILFVGAWYLVLVGRELTMRKICYNFIYGF